MVCVGQAGHGCLIQANTAAEKVQYMLNKFMEMRENEAQKLIDNPNLQIGDVTAINMTIMKGGLQTNIVPAELSITFDIRCAIDVDHDAFEQQVCNALILLEYSLSN